MIAALRGAWKWLWAVGAAIAAVAWMLLATRATSRQQKHDRRLEDLQDDQSRERRRRIDTEVESARRAAEIAKKRKQHAEKALDGMAKAHPDVADVLSRYNANRLRKPADTS